MLALFLTFALIKATIARLFRPGGAKALVSETSSYGHPSLL